MTNDKRDSKDRLLNEALLILVGLRCSNNEAIKEAVELVEKRIIDVKEQINKERVN